MKRVGQSLVVAAMLAIGAGVAMAQVDLELVPHPDVDQLKPEVRDNLRPAIEYFRTQRATLEGRKLGLAYGRIGINYLAYEQQAAAGACLRNAMALDPANPRWPYLLAVHYQETGFLDKSVESYRDALLADRTYLPGYVRLGRVLLEIGKLDEADSAFQVVLNANPAEAAALAGTGQVAFQRQEYEKAADFYQRALEIQPEASSLHYHLGMTYRALGRTDEARAQMDKAGERIPTVDDPMLAFVQAHTRGAAHYLEAAVKADESGHAAVAARFYEIATSIQPTNVPALVRLGELQGAAGNSDAALNAFARVLSIDPGNARANYFAGTLLEQRGDDEEARKLYEKALESQPQLVEPRMLLANAQMRVGEFAAAGDNYAQIAHQLPESKEVRYLLGLAFPGRRHDAGGSAGADSPGARLFHLPGSDGRAAAAGPRGRALHVREGTRARHGGDAGDGQRRERRVPGRGGFPVTGDVRGAETGSEDATRLDAGEPAALPGQPGRRQPLERGRRRIQTEAPAAAGCPG
jgi:tetratricopeptide (TPR) repeat protein